MNQLCEHLAVMEQISPKAAKAYECEECTKTGDRWVHLRTCQTCGVTLCCDSSPNKHATRHFQETGHPVVNSAEPGEKWYWCYQDKQMVRY